ncbi:MAG: DUF5615 family PIN-like protein [Lacipirellulaceae bacterium]
MAVRFHLDESMPTAVADGLEQRGHRCTTTAGVGLRSAPDDEQLAFATREGRVLVTRDEDFLALADQVTDRAGVVYWTQREHFGRLVRSLDALGTDNEAEELCNRVFFH